MSKGFEKVIIHSCGEGVVPIPVISENGNWFIGNDDTGVKAKGIDGKDGEVGPSGPQGPKGEKGDTGAVGPKGEKGDTGEVGPSGPQGPKGEKGDTGAVGPKGEKGDTGEVGPSGPKGDKGDAGETGPQGPKGDTPYLAANLTTTEKGKALDATMGKTLNDKIDQVSSDLGGLSFYEDADGNKYVVGADSVPKKLGDSSIYATYLASYNDNEEKVQTYTSPIDGHAIVFGSWAATKLYKNGSEIYLDGNSGRQGCGRTIVKKGDIIKMTIGKVPSSVGMCSLVIVG